MGWPKGKPRPWLKGKKIPGRGEKGLAIYLKPDLPITSPNEPVKLPGLWVKRRLGDGITIYASFDAWKQFYTKDGIHTTASIEINMEDGTKQIVGDAQTLDPIAVKQVFIARKVPPAWLNDPKSKQLLGYSNKQQKTVKDDSTTSLQTQEPASAA